MWRSMLWVVARILVKLQYWIFLLFPLCSFRPEIQGRFSYIFRHQPFVGQHLERKWPSKALSVQPKSSPAAVDTNVHPTARVFLGVIPTRHWIAGAHSGRRTERVGLTDSRSRANDWLRSRSTRAPIPDVPSGFIRSTLPVDSRVGKLRTEPVGIPDCIQWMVSSYPKNACQNPRLCAHPAPRVAMA